jgi:hypothetical protein
MEEAFAAFLLADGTVASLSGSRLSWAIRDQAAGLPCIVLTKVSGFPIASDEGDSGLVESRIQVDVWATNRADPDPASGYALAKMLARAVANRLSGIQTTTGGIDFQAIFTDTERDGFERAAGGIELYRVSQDYQVWHRPAA